MYHDFQKHSKAETTEQLADVLDQENDPNILRHIVSLSELKLVIHSKWDNLYRDSNNSEDIFKKLHKNGFNVTKADSSGWLPIHHACKNNDYKTLNYMIEQKIYNVNQYTARKTDKRTPLVIAITNRSVDCVSLLCNLVDEIDVGLNQCIDILSHDKTHMIVHANTLQWCIYHYYSDMFNILLMCLLKQQGIKDPLSYKANKVITFEFLYELYRFFHIGSCRYQLCHWLNCVIKYWQNLPVDELGLNSFLRTADSVQFCILCLNPIAIDESFRYFPLSDCIICCQCNEKENIRKVGYFFCSDYNYFVLTDENIDLCLVCVWLCNLLPGN